MCAAAFCLPAHPLLMQRSFGALFRIAHAAPIDFSAKNKGSMSIVGVETKRK